MFKNSSYAKRSPLRQARKIGQWLVVAGFLGFAGFRLAVAVEARPPAQGTFAKVVTESKAVKILTRREGETTHFLVENKEFCEITMTFDMGMVNLKGDKEFPYTATFAPGQVTEAFSVSPISTDTKWEYNYTNYYKLGSICARHDDAYEYQLPYAPGRAFLVTQGYNGKFSHQGPNQYATDWKMPEGTPVYAARGGIVVSVNDDSDKGGSSMDYDRYNNSVSIRHDDGTIGHYCHLQKGGGCVSLGQRVNVGDRIARSGNTGFSSGPHLHFCVFKTRTGRERESIPVKFRTSKAEGLTLVSGQRYKAAELRPETPVSQAVSQHKTDSQTAMAPQSKS